MSYSSEMETEAKWAEIDLDALTYNMKNIRQKVGEKVKICAVVKANAYGHSVEDLAEIMKEAGADQFAVSSLDEALELRQYEPDTNILVLGNIPYGTEEISVEADLQHAVTSLEKARSPVGGGSEDGTDRAHTYQSGYRDDAHRPLSRRRRSRRSGGHRSSARRTDRRSVHSFCHGG